MFAMMLIKFKNVYLWPSQTVLLIDCNLVALCVYKESFVCAVQNIIDEYFRVNQCLHMSGRWMPLSSCVYTSTPVVGEWSDSIFIEVAYVCNLEIPIDWLLPYNNCWYQENCTQDKWYSKADFNCIDIFSLWYLHFLICISRLHLLDKIKLEKVALFFFSSLFAHLVVQF